MLTDIKRQLESDASMDPFTATALSTSWVDLGTVVEDLGSGRPMHMRVNVTTAPTGVGAVRFECVALPVTTLAAMGPLTTTFSGSTVTMAAGVPPVGSLVVFTNSGGGLPAEITAGKTYFVITAPTATTCTVSATINGTAITTSGAGTGTHSAYVVTQVLGASGPIPAELLSVGSAVCVRLNPQPTILGSVAVRWPNCYRYVFGRWVETTIFPENAAPVVTGILAAGKWSAFLVDGADFSGISYPDGSNAP